MYDRFIAMPRTVRLRLIRQYEQRMNQTRIKVLLIPFPAKGGEIMISETKTKARPSRHKPPKDGNTNPS